MPEQIIEYARERIEPGEYRYVLYENGYPFVSYRVYRVRSTNTFGPWQIQDTKGMRAHLGRGERTLADVERRIASHYGDDAALVRRPARPPWMAAR